MATNLRDKAQFRNIDGVNYEVWPLPHGKAQRILMKFLRALGAAASALDAPDGVQMAALAKAVSDEDLEFIAAAFGDASAYEGEDGKPIPLVKQNHDLHFAGRFDAYLRWILFSAEVNFAGFFDTARRKAIADDYARLAPSEEPSKPTTA